MSRWCGDSFGSYHYTQPTPRFVGDFFPPPYEEQWHNQQPSNECYINEEERVKDMLSQIMERLDRRSQEIEMRLSQWSNVEEQSEPPIQYEQCYSKGTPLISRIPTPEDYHFEIQANDEWGETNPWEVESKNIEVVSQKCIVNEPLLHESNFSCSIENDVFYDEDYDSCDGLDIEALNAVRLLSAMMENVSKDESRSNLTAFHESNDVDSNSLDASFLNDQINCIDSHLDDHCDNVAITTENDVFCDEHDADELRALQYLRDNMSCINFIEFHGSNDIDNHSLESSLVDSIVTLLDDHCDVLHANNVAMANENVNTLYETLVEAPTLEMMIESTCRNMDSQKVQNEILLIIDDDASCVVNKEETLEFPHDSLDDEDVRILNDIAYMVENCLLDTFLFDLTDEFVETMETQPLVEPCRIEMPKMVEEVNEVNMVGEVTNEPRMVVVNEEFPIEKVNEVPTIEEQHWYKVEFIEVVPQVHELKHFIGLILQVPYRRIKSAYERAFFWYREGYSES